MGVSDKSPRTYNVARYSIIFQICSITFIIMILLMIGGRLYYGHIEKNSSTPKGTDLTFPVTNSKTQLKDIYTDKNKDVLIAKLSVPDSSELPFKGTDYKISMQSNSLLKYKNADILFGRVSTDGDMYLVIPKPKKEVYSVFIENTQAVTSGGTSYVDSGDQSDNEKSYSKAISDYKFEGNQTAKYDTGQLDAVGFRITIDPAFNKKAYKPEVLDTDLLENNKFKFDRFYNYVYKKKIINDLKQKHENMNVNYNDKLKEKKNADEQAKENPDDTAAKSKQSSLENELDDLKNKKNNLAEKLTKEQSAEYDNDLFENINKKAEIIKD